MLENNRRFARYPFAASVLFPEIERAFTCTLRDVSLGGAYVEFGDGEILSRLLVGRDYRLVIQGIGELDARVARKTREGAGLHFWLGDRLADGIKQRLVQSLTRELRMLYESWATDWQEKLRPAPPPGGHR